jgi:Restriction endonuclease
MWEREVTHNGLNKYRKIRGTDRRVVEQKADMQMRAWEDIWEKKVERDKARQNIEESKNTALKLTKEAEEKIRSIENTLISYLDGEKACVNWEKLKKHEKFSVHKPVMGIAEQKIKVPVPNEPLRSDNKYLPKFNILDYLSSRRKQEKINKIEELFNKDVDDWYKNKPIIEAINQEIENENKAESDKFLAEHTRKVENWKADKAAYLACQENKNKNIEIIKESFVSGGVKGIEYMAKLILAASSYPDDFPQEYTINFNANNHILVVEYGLPLLDMLPNLKEVRYIQTKNDFTEINFNDAVMCKLYDNLIYQIALRTIREIYDADLYKNIKSIVFNGWVTAIDKATGKDLTSCIMSVQTERDEFMNISLHNVDPKACFKKLKGVGSSKLYSLTPVAPILKIDRNDPRFIASYEVVDGIDNSVNLAAIDWQDFENLIREIFDKEFNKTGGEVKITRASRDGGVDAIAFDPDPIRGGKIVIQAKRYTNTVGVSAVRDLYGTLVSEGATKGILISTADYGPDSYSFAKDKPITLMDGANLLHLLAKHGHQARIDLKEAKTILAEKQCDNKKMSVVH